MCAHEHLYSCIYAWRLDISTIRNRFRNFNIFFIFSFSIISLLLHVYLLLKMYVVLILFSRNLKILIWKIHILDKFIPEDFRKISVGKYLNTLKPELNPICYLLALLAHHFLHVSRIRCSVFVEQVFAECNHHVRMSLL